MFRPRLRSTTGCLTCRKRRRKCDENSPVCHTCLRLNLKCVWKGTKGENDLSNVSVEATSLAGSAMVLRAPSVREFQPRICEAYTVNVFFGPMNHALEMVGDEGSMSIQVIHHFVPDREDSPGRLAWVAYCYIVFGDAYGIPSLKQKSRLECSKALSSLYEKVPSTESKDRLESLVAAVVLGMYEQHATTGGGSGWVVHTLGLMKLVESLGPDFFQHPIHLRLFENMRWGFVFAAILTQTQVSLDEDPWKTIPWSALGMHKKSIDQLLLDIMLRVPKTVQDLNMLCNTLHNDIEFDKAVDAFWEFQAVTVRCLQRWHEEFSRSSRISRWQPTDPAHRTLFQREFPMYQKTINNIALSWYFSTLSVFYSLASTACKLDHPKSRPISKSDHALNLPWPDADIYQEKPSWIEYFNNLTRCEGETTQDSTVADHLEECARNAAYSACVAIFIFMNGNAAGSTAVHTSYALLRVMKTFDDDTELARWATRTYYSGASFGHEMQEWFRRMHDEMFPPTLNPSNTPVAET